MSLRTSIAWTFSEQTLQQLLQLAAAIIIARLLTPEELGIFALAYAAASVLTALRTFGVGNYLIREPELNRRKVRSAFSVMLAMSWTLGLALYLGRDLVAELYGRSSIADVMALLALSFAIAPFGEPATALLTREMRFRTLHNIGLTSTAVGTALSISLAYAGYSYMSLAWGLLATSSLQTLLAMLANPAYALLRPSLAYCREIARFGGLLSLASLVGTLNSEGIRFILGGFAGPASVAQFNRAAQVPNVFRRGIFQPVGRVLAPAWAIDVRDGRSIGPAAEKLVAFNTVITWPVFLALGFISVPFITLVFGDNWRPAGEIFPWLLLSQAIIMSLPQPEQILVPHGRIAQVFRVRLCTAIFSVTVAIFAASLSFEAFAMSRCLAALFLVTMVFMAVRRLIAFRWHSYGMRYLRSAAVAVLAAIPAAAFRFTQHDGMSLLELLVIVVACGLLWLLGIAVTRHFVWGELMLVARRAFGN